ncbi:MAG: hypothetical protein VX904_05165, partial [Planctomycetota bacterium]|nr:hypothetical protein [Planctomycetota bacterium]
QRPGGAEIQKFAWIRSPLCLNGYQNISNLRHKKNLELDAKTLPNWRAPIQNLSDDQRSS